MNQTNSDGLLVDAPDTIFTWTGRQIRPLDPDPEDIFIEDIAHHLSMQCRFTGALDRFSSVAEHCVRVSWMVQGVDRDLALEALLHDASEAYLSDIARPVKKSPDFWATYGKYEARLERAVHQRFGLPVRSEMHPLIKAYDQVALLAEVSRFGSPAMKEALGVEEMAFPLHARPTSWTPIRAQNLFLGRYETLGGKYA